MNILLAIIIFVLMIYSYLLVNRMFSPPVIACISLGIAALIGAFYNDYWGYDLHFITVLVILFGLVALALGYLFGRKIEVEKEKISECKRFSLDVLYIITFVIIASVVIYAFYQEVNLHLLILQTAIEDEYALQHLHEAGRDTFNYSWYVKYPLALVQSVTFVCIYCFVYNVIKCGFIFRDLSFLVPIPYYIINSILRTDRNQILLLVLFSIVIYILLKKGKLVAKDLIIPAVLSSLFLLWFGLFRMIKTGIYDIQSSFDSICVYITAGIPAFDKLINGDLEITSFYFGGRSLRGFHNLMQSIMGIDYAEPLYAVDYGDGFVSIGDKITTYGHGVHTNVFTAFGGVYIDFGFWGIIIYFMLYGIVLGVFERYVYTALNGGYRYILYAYLMYPLFVLNFDEVLLFTIINPARFLSVLVGYWFYRFLYVRRVNV